MQIEVLSLIIDDSRPVIEANPGFISIYPGPPTCCICGKEIDLSERHAHPGPEEHVHWAVTLSEEDARILEPLMGNKIPEIIFSNENLKHWPKDKTHLKDVWFVSMVHDGHFVAHFEKTIYHDILKEARI
jgi:hypothetical protein